MTQSQLIDRIKERNDSIRSLSRNSGIQLTKVFRIMHGQPADFDTLQRLANCVGIEITIKDIEQ